MLILAFCKAVLTEKIGTGDGGAYGYHFLLNTEYCFGSAEIPFGVKFTLNGEWQLSSCSDMKQADIADKFKMSGDSPVSNDIEDFKECSSDKICNALFDNDPLTF